MKCIACTVVILIALVSAVAQAAEPPAWVLDWAQDVIETPMSEGAASIASLSVVVDGEVVLLKGYGRQDGPDGAAVDPQRDKFLIASITKTFTALAIAQLVEDGAIRSLDDPANAYLKRIQLPSYNGTEVRVRDLLAHTAGFEERGFGYVKHGATTIPASAAYAQAAVPEIVREPGGLAVYANIDPPLLGMIVEDVTGLTLQDYFDARIFGPLGMAISVLNYAPAGDEALARPWRRTPDGVQSIPHAANAPFFAPTGSVEASAEDMARYAMAVMGNGELSSDVRNALLTPLARNHPALPAMGMAWFLEAWNEQPVADHAGAFGVFSSWLVLIPETRTAMFFGWAGAPVKPDAKPFDFTAVRDSFLAAALGPHDAPVFVDPQPDYSVYAGRYFPERRPHTTPEAILALQGVETVEATPEGLFYRGQGPYKAIDDDVFALQSGAGTAPRLLVFEGDKIIQTAGASSRVSGVSDPGFRLRLAQIALIVGLTGVAAIAWRRGPAKWFAIALAPAAAALPAIMLLPSPSGSSLIEDLFQGNSLRFDILFALGAFYGIAAVVLAASLGKLLIMQDEQGADIKALTGRLHRGLLLFAALVLFAFIISINGFTLMRLP